MMTTTDQQVLDCPMADNDAGAATVREYFFRLLEQLWNETDGFSGKRPFGDSDWDNDVYIALAEAGIIEGEKDIWDSEDPEHGFEWEIHAGEYDRADKMILSALKHMMVP